jgi:hypothetical protein
MEPHADFMAGWGIGLDIGFSLEGAAGIQFELGDTDFNETTHQGEPEFRQAMVRAEVSSRDLDIENAFAEARKMAGLP